MLIKSDTGMQVLATKKIASLDCACFAMIFVASLVVCYFFAEKTGFVVVKVTD